jgi:hypothetical protein
MNDTEIAQQLLAENLDKPIVVPETHSGGKAKEFEIDGKLFSLQPYNFNYRQKGYARGLWLLCDLYKNNLKHCQCGIRLV